MLNIQLDDICRFGFISGVKLSCDGKRAAFKLHKVSEDRDGYDSDIYVCSMESEGIERITSQGRAGAFFWKSSKSITLENCEFEGEGTEFITRNTETLTVEESFVIKRAVSSIESDNDKLFFTSKYNRDIEEGVMECDNCVVVDEIPFWNNGSGYVNKNRNRLYVYDVKSGIHRGITHELFNVDSFTVNHGKVVIVGRSYDSKQEVNNEIYVYSIEDDKLERVSHCDIFQYSFGGFIDKDHMIFTGSDMKRHGDNENHRIFMMDQRTGEIRCLTPELEVSLWNTVGSDCRYGGSPSMMIRGEKFYFTTSEDGHSYLNSIDCDGNMSRVLKESGSVDGYDVLGEEIVFIGMRGSRLQEIYKVQDGEERRITRINQWVHEKRNIAELHKIQVESEPGIMVEGWVMKPAGYEDGKQYPGILNIHGGPKSAFGEVFYHEMQYWAANGYAVFFCNLRGSNNKDNSYSDIRGNFGVVDYKDIMCFTEKVLSECSFIDRERVGVTGGSYGGYMTNWIIGHTHLFKAAVSQRCISNWISKFNTTDIGYYWVKDQNGATPWSDVNKLWDHSPIKYADRVKTPTLFIHGEEDYRCYIGEGVQMFTALKYHGVESKMCIFKGANHELSRSGNPKQRMRRIKEITKWFDRYLK